MQYVSMILPSSAETGTIGIMHLKRYWARSIAKKNQLLPVDSFSEEWNTDNYLLNTLGLGLEQTIKQLFLEQQSFDQFEQWVLQVNNGSVDREKISHFNAVVQQQETDDGIPGDKEDVLSPSDIEFWNTNGYVIVRNAVSTEDCDNTIAAISDLLKVDINDPRTWYNPHPDKEGIMVQLFQHPVLEKNRHAPAIRRAYEQVWGRKDILVNYDKAGFNPPETAGWKFPASRLHWDVSLKQPIPFGTQGILYLTDTSAEQGAFTVVPGFHQKIETWLTELPADINPRGEILYQLGPEPVAAHAGDFIIWHHALPHAASPNKATKPRYVQYMNYAPAITDFQRDWI
jgi:hypothetical protein